MFNYHSTFRHCDNQTNIISKWNMVMRNIFSLLNEKRSRYMEFQIESECGGKKWLQSVHCVSKIGVTTAVLGPLGTWHSTAELRFQKRSISQSPWDPEQWHYSCFQCCSWGSVELQPLMLWSVAAVLYLTMFNHHAYSVKIDICTGGTHVLIKVQEKSLPRRKSLYYMLRANEYTTLICYK